MAKRISRRQFLSNSAAGTAALGVISASAVASSPHASPNPSAGNWVRWIDDAASKIAQGVTFGTPWPRGKQRDAKNFVLRGADQKAHALQSWPLAWWPDGSLKWTAHALPPANDLGDGPFEVIAQRTATKAGATLDVTESDAGIVIDTGAMVCRFARSGASVITSI